MQIGEQHLAFAQHGALDGLGFLDLDDHVRPGKDFFRGVENRCAGRLVLGVGGANTDTGVGFNYHVVTVFDHFTNAGRGHADAVFVILNLFWDAY